MEGALIDKPGQEPLFLSIGETARVLAVSDWQVKEALRRKRLRARKAGRRTIIEFQSVLELAESLPKAEFAPPRKRGSRVAVSLQTEGARL